MDKNTTIVKRFKIPDHGKMSQAKINDVQKKAYEATGIDFSKFKVKYPTLLIGKNECLERIEKCEELLQTLMTHTGQTKDDYTIEVKETSSFMSVLVFVRCKCNKFTINNLECFETLKEMIDLCTQFEICESNDDRLNVQFVFNDAYDLKY